MERNSSWLRSGGLYVLLFELVEEYRGPLGRRGLVDLPAGVYAYVGSAWGPGGLAARLRRHLCRGARRLWWHIDYLSTWRGYRGLGAVVCPGAARRLEPLLAAVLAASRVFRSLGRGLGGSDDRLGFGHFFAHCGDDVWSAAFAAMAAFPCVPRAVPAAMLCSQIRAENV